MLTRPVTRQANRRHLIADVRQTIDQDLELPLDLDPEDDRVFMAAESQGAGATLWERYGRELYSCLRLYHAARHSIATGAAIVFT